MITIEAPTTVETTTVTIEPNDVQKALYKMLDMVKAGKWCRNTVDDGYGRACALGLVNKIGN